MESEADRNGLGLLAAIAGTAGLIGTACLFVFILVFMNYGSGGTVLHGLGNPNDLGPPITAGSAAAIAVIVAIGLPRLVLRPLRRRIDGPRRLEGYGAALFLTTSVVASGVLLLAFVAAFMTQELLHFLVAVPFAFLPLALVWPTESHRVKWAAGSRSGA